MGTETDDNEVINLQASLFIRRLLGVGGVWTLSEPTNDKVGLDYQVVLRDEARIPDVHFLAQLKGRGPQTRKGKPFALVNQKGNIAQAMDMDHLEFYLKTRDPVFLLIVDVVAQKGYWVHLQRYMKELGSAIWREQLAKYRKAKGENPSLKVPKMTVAVPTRNDLSDIEGFQRAVREARGYMLEVGIKEGIEHVRRTMQERDPRFDVGVTIEADGSHNFVLNAKEDVAFSISIGPNQAAALIGRGVPVEFKPGEFKVEGCPHIEDLFHKGGTVQFISKLHGIAHLRRVDKEGNVIGSLEDLQCIYEGGQLERRFAISSPSGVIDMQGILITKAGDPPTLNTKTSPTVWHDRDINCLSYLDTYLDFLGNADDEDHLEIGFRFRGKSLATLKLGPESKSVTAELRNLVRPLWMAREIARELAISLRTPKRFKLDDLDTIQYVYNLINQGKAVSRDPLPTITATASKSRSPAFFRKLPKAGDRGTLNAMIPVVFDFFGATFSAVELRHEFTDMRMKVVKRTRRKGDEEVSVDFSPTPCSTLTYHSPDDSKKSLAFRIEDARNAAKR